MLAHQWYILPFSPPYFLAFALRSVTDPAQLAPARFTLPGLLLPLTFPSAKFSIMISLIRIQYLPNTEQVQFKGITRRFRGL